MKLARTAMLFAASGVILITSPAAASAQAAAKASVPTCTKVGIGHTTAWVKCKGRGYARLEYKCKQGWPFNGWNNERTGWYKVKLKSDTKIVATCKRKIGNRVKVGKKTL